MRFKRLKLLMGVVGLSLVSPVQYASTLTLPNSAQFAEGATSSSTTAGVLGTGNFTNQFFYTSALLSSIPVGYEITGFRVRADAGLATGTYPSAALHWNNYDVTLAEAAVSITAFGSSSNVAANMLNPQQVLSGALDIAVNSFTDSAASFNPFGPLISFTTPYLYQGGDLIFLVSHGTATGTGFSVDASNTGFGYTNSSQFAQRVATSYNATTVNTTSAAPVIQLEFGPHITTAPVPELDTLTLFLIGSFPLIARAARTRRQYARSLAMLGNTYP